MNVVHLVGRLGQDPATRFTHSGEQVANAGLATNDHWRDKQGVKQQRVEWHRLVFWKKAAEIATKYLHKGDLVGIDGTIRTRKWTDNANNARESVEIHVSKIHFMPNSRPGQESAETADTGSEEDIPF
jgi:single-strand DNA-binding protein